MEEKQAYWYNGQELVTMDKNYNALIAEFRKTGRAELSEAEDYFNEQWGHSLRGLEAMKDCQLMYQAKIIKLNRSMLDCKGKDKAMKRSKKNAQKAYQMGLYDEENSMCYAETRKQESIRRKSIAPDSLSSSRHGDEAEDEKKKHKSRMRISVNLRKRLSRSRNR
eukprot:CAMPEP_0116029100 /NCGR_PEP_ID=MMETSP0321-20121206/15902_1 /TAXON_ID=163516 /ORGANISM="Leptocylindrus danicus var. danicus, Strain B650" /LENGTH=164 /DNA_ID=CAMNT_0003503339 /DNA_START=120 /DNA_END=614 /DNA_ORIENTATION=+